MGPYTIKGDGNAATGSREETGGAGVATEPYKIRWGEARRRGRPKKKGGRGRQRGRTRSLMESLRQRGRRAVA